MAQLLDQHGNPIDFARLKAEESAPTIAGVRQILSDHPWQGLTPIRLGQILLAAEQGDADAYLEVAEEAEEKDLHYRSVLGTRKLQVSQLDITIEAASDGKADQIAADLARERLVDSGVVSEYLFDQLDAVGKGYSVGEIRWDTEGKQWAPIAIDWRDPRWFEFDRRAGRTLLLKGGAEGIGPAEPLKPYGYVTHIHRTKSGLPIRGGLARACLWLCLFKNFDVKAWIEFLEGFGQPVRLGKYGSGATEADKAKLLRAVRSMWKDSAAIIPDGMAIEWLEAKVTGNVTVQQGFADWADKQTSKAVLGQTMTTDDGASKSQGEVHERVKDDIEKDDGKQAGGTLTRDVVRPTIDLNLGPMTRYPRVRIYRPDQEDLEKWLKGVSTFVAMGGEVESSVVRDKLGLPDPPAGADIKLLRSPGVAPAPTAPTDPTVPPAAKVKGEPATQAQQPGADPGADTDAIDDLNDQVLDDEGWRPMMDPIIGPVEALLAECKTAEEFLGRLPELAAAIDTGPLAEALAQATFAARMAGEAEEDLA